jgi:hypothetical protein
MHLYYNDEAIWMGEKMGIIRYLLDTHTFLRAVSDNRKLGQNVKKIINIKHLENYIYQDKIRNVSYTRCF